MGGGCREGCCREGCCREGRRREGCCREGCCREGRCREGRRREGCCREGCCREGCCREGCCREGRGSCNRRYEGSDPGTVPEIDPSIQSVWGAGTRRHGHRYRQNWTGWPDSMGARGGYGDIPSIYLQR